MERALHCSVDAKSVADWNASAHPWVVENKPDQLDAGASVADVTSRKISPWVR